VRDHLQIGEALGAIDMERGAKVSGARFYFLTGPGALLEFASPSWRSPARSPPGSPPSSPRRWSSPRPMEGTGFLGEHDEEVYRVERDDLYLVGTSEVALAGMHADEVLDLSAGPLRYAGWSSCFRREAGSYGKDTRGIIRVHWFDKVEMFSFCRPEETEPSTCGCSRGRRSSSRALELPYRVVDIAAGDLGTSAARKYDIEAWFPSQGTYRELTSTSDCTTFQARRLAIRYRDADGRPQTAATLNGTLCAIARTIACLLEVHQRADGSVHVPAGAAPVARAGTRCSSPAWRSPRRCPSRERDRAARPSSPATSPRRWPPRSSTTATCSPAWAAGGRGCGHRPRRHPAHLRGRGQPRTRGRARGLLGGGIPVRRRYRPRAAAARQRPHRAGRARHRGARAGRLRRRPGARRGAAHRRPAARAGDRRSSSGSSRGRRRA
jgi:hypothetical protein